MLHCLGMAAIWAPPDAVSQSIHAACRDRLRNLIWDTSMPYEIWTVAARLLLGATSLRTFATGITPALAHPEICLTRKPDALDQDLVLFVRAMRELLILYCTNFDDLGTTDGMIRLAEAIDLVLRSPRVQRVDEALFCDLMLDSSTPGDEHMCSQGAGFSTMR